MKTKVKIKTENEKIVETDIWHETYEKKKVLRVRKKQCNVAVRMDYL